MTYYLDTDYRLHVKQEEGTIPWWDEYGLFNGRSESFIEGYRVVPEGHTWIREDGEVFEGFMMAPAVHYETLALEDAQAHMADMQNALETLGVSVNG